MIHFSFALVFLLASATHGKVLDALTGTECEQLYEAIRDAMEVRRPDFVGPQDFFAHIGLSLDKDKQLKKFACKLPGVKTIQALADIAPSDDFDAVAGEYFDKLYLLNKKGGGVPMIIKRLRLYTTIYEEAVLPSNVAAFPWSGVDELDVLIFFKKMVKEFGEDFPTFLMSQASSLKRDFYNMTDVDFFVKTLFQSKSMREAAEHLGISEAIFHAFLRVLYFAKKEDSNKIRVYKNTYVLMQKLDDIGFFELNILK